MVATTILVVAFTHVRWKGNLTLLIYVTSKTGFALTLGTSFLYLKVLIDYW